MGGAVSAGIDHDDLIDKLKNADYIKTLDTELVFRAVDRGFYFLPECKDGAYRDLAWKKGNIHLSAPCIYGEVMESLKLKSGMSFLNLGSGTGYLSTMVGLALGTYGINHGIELHEDVVDYANTKLIEFKDTSPALDCYEFCEPQFVKGNSLCLSGNTRQYDRVYCGAACPENHESYMKNLLKIGGILVMPLNDQLMQITRISQSTWISNSVLSVSFATLQTPSTDSSVTFSLPEVQPLSLQELCRSTIRIMLRKNAQEAYPNIAVRQRKKYSAKRKKHFHSLHAIIPIMDNSEDEGGLVNNVGARRQFGLLLSRITQRPCTCLLRLRDEGHADGREMREITGALDEPILRRHANRCDCTIGIHSMPLSDGDWADEDDTNDGEDDDDEDEEEDEEDDEDDEDEEEGEENEEDVEGEDNTATRNEDENESSDCDGYVDIGNYIAERKRKREKFDSGICTDMDNTQEGGGSSFSDTDSSDDTTMEVDYSDPSPSKSSKSKPRVEYEDVPVYSVVMREKISMLPLPSSLKDYLNYNRSFK